MCLDNAITYCTSSTHSACWFSPVTGDGVLVTVLVVDCQVCVGLSGCGTATVDHFLSLDWMQRPYYHGLLLDSFISLLGVDTPRHHVLWRRKRNRKRLEIVFNDKDCSISVRVNTTSDTNRVRGTRALAVDTTTLHKRSRAVNKNDAQTCTV